jgi:putative hydrolase of the HAD superfamily
MGQSTAIKALSFDAVGTLFHLRRSVGGGYAEVAARFGLQLDPAEVDRAFRQVWKTARQRPDGPREDDDRGLWREIVRDVLKHCGATLEPEPFAAFFSAAYASYEGKQEWQLYPETVSVLEELSPRFRLAIISNYDARLYPTLEELGIRPFFETVTVSSEAGSDKPSAGIFHTACRSLGLSPPEILHVGDEKAADLDGPVAAGLSAWLVERPAMSLRDLPVPG